MRGKIIPTITTLAIFLFYILSLIFKGLDFLQNNIISGIIFALSIFLLPALISKVILKKKYFSLGYIFSTLIYPFIYLIGYILSTQFDIDIKIIYTISSLLIFFSTLYLFLVEIYRSDIHESKKLSKAIVGILIVIGIILGIRYFVGLDNDSAISLDFLQHNAVSMQMSEGKLCLTPNDCSSLFKKLGYTSYFHTIQTVLTIGFNLDLGIAETSFNIAFIVTAVLSIFSFFQKHFKDDETSFIASLIAISVFELGAYSFNFSIPQTLTLLLFLNVLGERKLSWIKLIVVSPILLASHFIFGPFFIAILFIYQIFFNDDIEEKNNSLAKTVSIILFIGVIVSFVANLRGFSVEKLLQKSDIEQLGFYTNLYYPDNLLFIVKQYGPLVIPFVISAIYTFFNKKTSNISPFAISYISLCLIAYFLGPTYANKFFIGTSVFMVFNILILLRSLQFKRFFKILLLIFLFLSMIPLYVINLSKYNTFYTQNNGKISSIVKEDNEILKFLKNTDNLNCQIVSDPYSQLTIASETRFNTAGGQYQELFTRKALIDFVENPDENNYESLLTSTEIKEPFCILLSSRLFSKDMYVNSNNIPWLNSMYEYEINNNYGVGNISDIIEFLSKKGFQIYYFDNDFWLFTPILEE